MKVKKNNKVNHNKSNGQMVAIKHIHAANLGSRVHIADASNNNNNKRIEPNNCPSTEAKTESCQKKTKSKTELK